MTREQYLNRRNELLNQAQAHIEAHETEQANEVTAQIEQLDAEYEASARAQANLDALRGAPVNCNPTAMAVNTPTGAPVATFGSAAGTPENTDTYDHAFMNFACRGTAIPSQYHNAAIGITESSAAIPTTTLREIIRELKSVGSIYSQIRHSNIQGGVEVPIITLMPEAKWVGEGSSTAQTVEAKQKVSFSYHGIECKISQKLLANVVDIKEFNDLFVPLAVEAIMKALEIGVFKGTGSGQMLGITKDTRIPEKNVVTLSSKEISDYKSWKKKVFGIIKKAYSTGKFYMAEGTYQGEIDGMVDTNGQPVARTNYGISGGSSYFFGGKAVETVEDDIIVPYETAAEGDVIAVFGNLKNYDLNSNMQMTTTKWTDPDTNEVKTKVMLICDGKVLDPNGFIIIKKGA